MLRFISFGSGSSGNCYLLALPDEALIIDAGVGLRALKKFCKDFGLSLSSVRHVLITHDHADHIKSVGSLSHEFHLPVYATDVVHGGIIHNYCVQRKISADCKFIIEKGVTRQIGRFSITPFDVPHDSSDNVGFFIEADGQSFCIITDAGSVTPEMASYISRTNRLVIEANHDLEMLQSGPYPQYLKDRIVSGHGHLSNSACGTAIAENMSEELKNVWLCHLSEENNHPELARKTVEAILRQHGVIAGVDLRLEVLKRNLPTGIFEL